MDCGQLTDTKANLVIQAQKCLDLASEFAWDTVKEDGHWMGELRSNVTITAEQVFFYQSLGIPIPDADAYRRYILSQQQSDGSWSIAPHYPGDVTTSSEAYLALKILGVPRESSPMLKAASFIRQAGGVAKVRIFTRIFFAQFGLFPWDAIPQLPVEFILMPPSFPVNIYRLSSWARSTLVPLLILRHHQRVYALPNGLSEENDFIDELWVNPSNKMVSYNPSIFDSKRPDAIALFFSAVDQALYWLGGLKWQPLRPYAIRKCVDWIIEHQEPEGDWAGIIPPMHAGIQALILEGYTLDDELIQRGLAAVERFTWEDHMGKRLQSCISPLWDTVMMVRGLHDAGVDSQDPRLLRSLQWIKARQVNDTRGDWSVYRPNIPAGGFSFEYYNTWYPDLDDTGAAVLSFLEHDPSAVNSSSVSRAVLWICGMQNKDGGWGAFDADNDHLWLNSIPFSDMGAVCDPSTPDVAGRALEVCGKILKISEKQYVDPRIIQRITTASEAGIEYIRRTQERDGSWFGRWATNYIFGTSDVLCGLQFYSDRKDVRMMMDAGISWLKRAQNADGGWGEVLESYRDSSLAGKGPSTPSQTAWGLMALLTRCRADDESILVAVAHLTSTQEREGEAGASWPETRYTGTGFPNFFYLGYDLYRHYFPMIALGKFVKAAASSSTKIV